jgi:hypothetical protein
MCCKSQVDWYCVKHCHRVAGPVWLFNDRPICSCGFRRSIGEYFLNGICGVTNFLVCDVFYLPSLQRQPLPSVRRQFQREPCSMMYFILRRCFIYLDSFIPCSCEGFKRTRTIYRPFQRPRTVHPRMSIVSAGPWAYGWECSG